MTALAVAGVVVLADLGVKALLRRRLGSRAVSLGPLGALRIVGAPLWLTRADARFGLLAIWTIWALAAGTLMVVSAWLPAPQPFVGLLLGGSISNALERSLRGSVSDYVCLRWWPAFNLADAAVTAGAIGLVAQILRMAEIAVS